MSEGTVEAALIPRLPDAAIRCWEKVREGLVCETHGDGCRPPCVRWHQSTALDTLAAMLHAALNFDKALDRERGSSDTRLTEATFAEQLDALIFEWWGETEIDSPDARSALKNLKRAAEDLSALAAARADAPQEQTP